MIQKRLQNHHVKHLKYTQSFVWEDTILPCRPRIDNVNQMGPNLTAILLPPSPECSDYKCDKFTQSYLTIHHVLKVSE